MIRPNGWSVTGKEGVLTLRRFTLTRIRSTGHGAVLAVLSAFAGLLPKEFGRNAGCRGRISARFSVRVVREGRDDIGQSFQRDDF